MGVALKNADAIGQTSQLVDWITKVRCKKLNVKKQRRKNLHVEAVLANALMKAETELRIKQQERLKRWQQIKTNYSYNVYNATMTVAFDTTSCEDLNSLDSFMSQLKNVKSQLER